MQKKLLILLTVLVVGLLIANVVVLTLGLKRLTEKSLPAKTSPEISQTSAAPAGSAAQIKQATLNHSFVVIPAGVPRLAPAVQDQESIGAQAGKTVGELQQKSRESYEVLNQQARQTAAQLEKTSQEAVKVLNEQTSKTSQEVQTALANILQQFNVELEKFNEELKKKQTV